jgi:transcriptional regulator with GAF, ATPase, and Fis domain
LPMNPESTTDPPEPGLQATAHHLSVLRGLLARDHLGRADWSYTLSDLARMALEALGATGSLVALPEPDGESWSAITSEGRQLEDREISRHGSRTVLETVRDSGQPFLTTDSMPLELSTESLRTQQVGSVLAAPLYWWDVKQEQPERQFGACLYVHRTWEEEPFSADDVALLLDIARIAQPTLNLLRYLADVETHLAASREHLRSLQQAAAQDFRLGDAETRDPELAQRVLMPLKRVAQADKVSLLLIGPTGSGKTHLARAYHYESPRRDAPFIVLDCAQITSEQTMAAELFGYAPRSGFANAPPAGRPGAAQLAHRGSLFIDEVGTLPSELQQRLLALIQTGTYSPLGSSESRHADIQIITATNEDLERLVQERRFREDLYWRLSVVTIRLPPLSERKADIPGLAERFLEKARRQFGRRDVIRLSKDAVEALVAYDWSLGGNIRGLENTIYRSVLLAPPNRRSLGAKDLHFQLLLGAPSAARQHGASGPLHQAAPPDAAARRRNWPEEIEQIRAAILEHTFATQAAKALGITYSTLVWKLRRAGLSIRDVLAEREQSP